VGRDEGVEELAPALAANRWGMAAVEKKALVFLAELAALLERREIAPRVVSMMMDERVCVSSVQVGRHVGFIFSRAFPILFFLLKLSVAYRA